MRAATIILAGVLAATPLAARTMYLGPEGGDGLACWPGNTFRTLARAAECLEPGDTLLIREGVYPGGVTISARGTAARPILIRGESLAAVIEGSGAARDGLRLEGAAHLTLDRLTVRGAQRAGAYIFRSEHITVSRGKFQDNGVWGIVTSFADDLAIVGNECCGSIKEHGIYHANSGDRFHIAWNIVHDNSGNGIHLNGDPEIEGGDGVLDFGVVEGNTIFRNGRSGGAGINMTHVHDVLVRNNLLYDNLAGGFTVYQDTGAPEQGSKRVAILGNTVYYRPGEGRAPVNIQTTSEQVLVAGNILVSGGERGGLMVNSDHLPSIAGDRNIYWGAPSERLVERGDSLWSLERWRALTGNDPRSRVADPLFRDPANGDFSLRPGSPARASGMPVEEAALRLEALGGCDWLIARLREAPAEDVRRVPRGAIPSAGALEAGPE